MSSVVRTLVVGFASILASTPANAQPPAIPTTVDWASVPVVAVADPHNASMYPYIPVPDMDLLCGSLFIDNAFKCTAVWESGVVGKISHTHACGTRWCTSNNMTVASAIRATLEEYTGAFQIAPPGAFRWKVGRRMALTPVQTEDGTHIWLPPPPCERSQKHIAGS